MKTKALAALAFLIVSSTVAAAPPFAADTLRAVWSAPNAALPVPPSCTQFVMVETGVSFQARTITSPFSPPVIVVAQGAAIVAGPFVTAGAAEDWLIQLFIRVNGLDATLDDVPAGPGGARDCAAWNTQLVQPGS